MLVGFERNMEILCKPFNDYEFSEKMGLCFNKNMGYNKSEHGIILLIGISWTYEHGSSRYKTVWSLAGNMWFTFMEVPLVDFHNNKDQTAPIVSV